jgi:hypothetical protein
MHANQEQVPEGILKKDVPTNVYMERGVIIGDHWL